MPLNPKQLSIMIDVDGTISADPAFFCDLMCALKADDNIIHIVSGGQPNSPSGPTWQSKTEYLHQVGVVSCWNDLTVVTGDIPEQKALYAQTHHVSIAIDNDKKNAQSLVDAGVNLVLVPWATRTPQKGKK